MQSREFSAILRQFADVLDAAGATVARDQIAMFATAFDGGPASSVSDFARRITSLPGPGRAGSPSLGDLARLISALSGLLSKTAKKSVLTDLDTIQKLLLDRPSTEIGAFVSMATEILAPSATPTKMPRASRAPKAREDLVLRYKERLEASLGDEDRFSAILSELRGDTNVGKPEIVALAKQMTGSGARTEDAALKKIWNRHRSLVVFRAKSRATGGRSAA
jgi:hypothetical protein